MAAAMGRFKCAQCGEKKAAKRGDFCADCYESTCLICGQWREPMLTRRYGEGAFPDFWYCSYCEADAWSLLAEEIQALVEIEAIEEPFRIWPAGQREDMGEGQEKLKDIPVPQPAEITKDLFLGDLDDASDIPLLESKGIGAVLNLCPEHMSDTKELRELGQQMKEKGILYQELKARDMRTFDIIHKIVLPDAADLMEDWIEKQGKKVLVNCFGGVNRSAVTLAGYLVLRKNEPLVPTVQKMAEMRGRVLSNRIFRLQLVRAAHLGPGGTTSSETGFAPELPKAKAKAKGRAARL